MTWDPYLMFLNLRFSLTSYSISMIQSQQPVLTLRKLNWQDQGGGGAEWGVVGHYI